MSPKTDPKHVLVVEDNAALREMLARVLEARGWQVSTAETVAQVAAIDEHDTPRFVVVDVDLPDGSAFDVLEHVDRWPVAPAIVAMSGVASPDAAFRLAQAGVREYLTKPLSADELTEALARATTAPDLRPQLRRVVGWVGVHEVEKSVRDALLDEALERTNGNRSAAARLLRVSRQLLQHMVRERTS